MKFKSGINVVAVVGALCHSIAYADISMYFDPTPIDVQVGQSFTVDVLADLAVPLSNGLDDIISAFDFNVDYADAILAPNWVTFGGYLGDGSPGSSLRLEPVDFSVPGTFFAYESSDLSDTDLALLQGGGPITLVSINFVALAETTDASILSISFDPVFGQDVKGRVNPGTGLAEILDVGLSPGEVNVAAVPVPTTAALMVLGLLGVGAARRRAA